jgi:transcription-repair coupling factor (superfamily II helicase)
LIYHDPEAICNQIIQDAKDDVDALGKDLEDIKNYHNLERLHSYISYMTSKPSSLLDYLDDPILILEEVKHIEENYEKTIVELASFLEEKRSPVQDHLLYYFDAKALIHSPVIHLYLSEFRQGYPGYQFDALFDLHGFLTIDYGNDIQSLATDLKTISRPIILTASTVQTLGLIEEILKDRKLIYQKIDEIPSSFQNMIILRLR